MWKSCLSLPVYPSHCPRWCDPEMLFVIHQNIKSTEPEITSLKLSLWIKAMGRWSFSARILKIILLSPPAPGWLITDPALLVPPSSGLQTTASCHPAMFSLIHLKQKSGDQGIIAGRITHSIREFCFPEMFPSHLPVSVFPHPRLTGLDHLITNEDI